VWWRNRPGGKLLTAADYNLHKEDFDEDAVYALFKLSALALQLFRYGGRLNTNKGGQSYAMLDQMGFYSNLMRSTQSVDDILAALMDGGMANRAEDLANLHWLLIIRRSLKTLGEEGVKALLEAESMSDVVTGLWQHIGNFHLTYEIIWIARELAAMGVLSCEDKEVIGVVPLPKVRETAFRLGFIETPYAADLRIWFRYRSVCRSSLALAMPGKRRWSISSPSVICATIRLNRRTLQGISWGLINRQAAAYAIAAAAVRIARKRDSTRATRSINV
jgi:hypothetical protein